MSRAAKLSWVFAPLLFFTFGLASLGQLQRIDLTLARAIYLHEIAITVFTVLACMVLGIRFKQLPSVWMLFLGWILVSIAGIWVQGTIPAAPILYFLRFAAYLGFGLFLSLALKQKLLRAPFVLGTLIASIVMIAVLGWLQYFFIPDTRNLVYLGWDDHYLRLISTLFDPGFTGAVLALGGLVLQERLFSGVAAKGYKFALLQWSWLVVLSALLFTYSRASYLAFAAGALVLAIRGRKLGHLFVVLAFAFTVLLLPRGRSEGVRLERTASINARIESYTSNRPGTLGQIVFGSGWYSAKSESTRLLGGNEVPSHNSAPDNSFVFIYSTLGVTGLVLFLFFLRSLGKLGKWSKVSLAGLSAIGVHALFSNTLFYPFVLLYLLAIIAVESARKT